MSFLKIVGCFECNFLPKSYPFSKHRPRDFLVEKGLLGSLSSLVGAS